MRITNQIKELVDHGDIDLDAAVVLMLTAQAEILERQHEQEERAGKVASRIRVLEDRNKYYPSLTWMWINQRRTLIMTAVAIALIYTFIFSPWLISDIRHALLSVLGLPVDLGLTAPG